MNTIPGQVQAVLDLFATALIDVRFADLDTAALSRVATDVNSAAERVAAAQAQLDEACALLKERQNALFCQAQRALAYARVYAESDETLSTRLEGISLPRPARRSRGDDEALILSPEPQAAAPRRRRSPTTNPPEAPLDGAAAAE